MSNKALKFTHFVRWDTYSLVAQHYHQRISTAYVKRYVL
jgi:hypothetical protein